MEGSKRSLETLLDESVQPKKPRLSDPAHDPWENEIALEVQPFEWCTEPLDGGMCNAKAQEIRCWCKDSLGGVNLLRFTQVPFTVYMELPSSGEDGRTLGWNASQQESLHLHVMKSDIFGGCRPVDMERVRKPKLYYASTSPSKFLRLRFKNLANQTKFVKIARETVCLQYIGQVKFPIHEDNVKILSKFLARTNTRCTQWMRVACTPVSSSNRISRPGIGEYMARSSSVEGLDRETIVSYKVLSFDIESYSSVENRFCNALNPADAIFSISVVTESIHPGGDSEDKKGRKRWCLCIGACAPVTPQEVGDEDNDKLEYEVVECKDEASLVQEFASVVVREDPDVITGHNIWGFDMKYLYMRANLVLKNPLPDMGRLACMSGSQLSSTHRVPPYQRNSTNVDFITRHLEERMPDEDFDSEYIDPNMGTKDKQLKSNRRLVVVDGKLQLSQPPKQSLDVLYAEGAKQKQIKSPLRVLHTF